MKYVILDGNLPISLINAKGFVPENSIRVPDSVRSIEEINVLDVADEFGELQKVVSIDPGKVAAYEAKLAGQLAAEEARAAARQATIDKIKGKKAGDLNNIAEVKQAIEDILAYLGLE